MDIELIIVIIGFVYLIFSNRSLSGRLSALEERLKNGVGVNMGNVQTGNAVTPPPPPVSAFNNQQMPEQVYQAAPVTSEGPNKFTAWLKEDWLMKLGAFLFIIGFGWFVSYAFINNWIGPVGRISIGILAGVIIVTFGFWRMMKYPLQGAVFMALGAGMTMLTIFAGISIYNFFTPVLAVVFDFIIISFVAFASYKFNVRSLAMIAQVLAFLAPLLSAGYTDSVFLFSYLFFVSLATLLLASVTGWRDLIVSSLVFVGLYSIPYIAEGGFGGYGRYAKDAPTILNFAFAFSMMYLIVGMFAVIKKGVLNYRNEILLAVLNGLFLFLWIFNVAPKEWSVMLFAFWAIVFGISSFVTFYLSSELAPFYAYGSVAVAFIGAATAAQLDGATLTIAFILEVVLIVTSVLMLTKSTQAISRASLLFIIPAVMSLNSLSKYAFSKDLFSQDFWVLALMALALIFVGRLITSTSDKEKNKLLVQYGYALVIIGTFYVWYIIWQFLHILMSPDRDMATMASLIIFTIFGLIAFFSGLYGADMARRTYGTGLLAFVVIRLILVDVWNMELFGRVITFLAIGVLLMSTAFFTKRKKNELPPQNYQQQ